MALSRDAFFSRRPILAVEEVLIPELGGSVHVREMSAGERDRYEVAVAESRRKDFRARLVVACACDDKGVSLFTQADIPALTAYPAAVLNRIAEAALKLNRVGESDVEDAEKNSDPTPAVAS